MKAVPAVRQQLTWVKLYLCLATLLASSTAIQSDDSTPARYSRPPLRERFVAILPKPIVPVPREEGRPLPDPQLGTGVSNRDLSAFESGSIEQSSTGPTETASPALVGNVLDKRPRIFVYTMAGCRPCQALQADINAGALAEFQVEFRSREQDQWPNWVEFAPRIHFLGRDGQWYVYPRRESNGRLPAWGGPAGFRAAWHRYGQRSTDETSSAIALGASPAEQFERFAGTSGTITFVPDGPIRATLEDGTVLSYSRITARYAFRDRQPVVTFDPPLPRIDMSRFWMHFGAQIQDARWEPPAAIAVGTNRGRFRIQLEKVP